MAVPVLSSSRVRSVQRGLVSAAAVQRSPFTGEMRPQIWGGEWWTYEFEIGPFEAAEGRALDADLNSLKGRAGTFLLEDPSAANAVTAGSPMVDGGGQSGAVLNTKGWTPSVAVFSKGDFFSLGSDTETRLYQVTDDVVSDASGLAAVPIQPNLRLSTTDSEFLETTQPRVLLRLTSPAPAGLVPGILYTWAVSAEEDL